MNTKDNITYRTKMHWLFNIIPIFMIIIGLLGFPIVFYSFGVFELMTVLGFVLIYVFYKGLLRLLKNLKTQILIHQNNLTIETGVFTTRIIDIPLNKFEGVWISQSLIGKVLNFGHLTIDTGGVMVSYPIINPLEFRKYLINQNFNFKIMNKAILGAVILLSANLSAQISNEQIVSMKKAGISEEIIKTKVATEDSKFDVSPNAILELKKNEISDEVISLMMQKKAALKAYSERTGTDVTNEETIYITSIEENGNSLLINNKITISKGDYIQIYLPALGNKEFSFINQNKIFNTKLLSKVADVVGTGATAIGVSSGNLKTLQSASKVINTANAVQYGADAIEKINDLPISKNAKKIAGQKMKVLSWKRDDENYILTGELNKKKYTINLWEAVASGEIKLK